MRAPIAPSFNFLLLVLVFSGTGAALWHGALDGRLAVFVLVVSGWIVGLCLHEFAHALTAHFGGDTSIDGTGYLTLDPLKYTEPVLSLILPVLYIFLGGFGLPGGAVYIRTSLLRSAAWESAVSAAGPAASLAFLVLVAAILAVAPVSDDGDITDFQAGLGVLAYFQATAVVLNLLPRPRPRRVRHHPPVPAGAARRLQRAVRHGRLRDPRRAAVVHAARALRLQARPRPDGCARHRHRPDRARVRDDPAELSCGAPRARGEGEAALPSPVPPC